MRPAAFDPSALRQHLRRHKIADLRELKRVLGTDTALTVFRKLKQLGYLASYTHRGRFYTLSDIARFDDRGLWSHQAVCFSRYGTLLATVEAFVFPSDSATVATPSSAISWAWTRTPSLALVSNCWTAT